jgi:hypothetical protein
MVVKPGGSFTVPIRYRARPRWRWWLFRLAALVGFARAAVWALNGMRFEHKIANHPRGFSGTVRAQVRDAMLEAEIEGSIKDTAIKGKVSV